MVITENCMKNKTRKNKYNLFKQHPNKYFILFFFKYRVRTNNKVKKEGLEVLVDILDLIHDLQHEIRENYKEIAKLKYENAVAYKENAIIKTEFSTYKHNLKKAELDSHKNE